MMPEELADVILAKIKPVKELALAEAERLTLEGDGHAAQKVMQDGIRKVAKIIHDELARYLVETCIIELLKKEN